MISILTSLSPTKGPDTENTPVSERTLGDFLSNVKDKDVINVEKVDNASSGDRISLPDAQAQGLFKDGKMEARNAVITEPGVTHFSVAGMRARTAGANMEASYVDPADGKRKFVIPVKGARLSTGFTPGQLNAPLGGHKDVSLAALLHYPALYQAYPWLADMRVRLYNPTEKQDRRQGTNGAGGFFCPPMDGEAGYIAVNSRYVNGKSDLLLNVLLHESQHAVQSYEGHARGAGFNSTEDALEYIDKAIAQREKSGVGWLRS